MGKADIKPRRRKFHILSTGVSRTPDVFTDVWTREVVHFDVDFDKYLRILWEENPDVYKILNSAPDVESARESLYDLFNRRERGVFDVDNELHILEKSTIRACISVLKSIIAPINELRADVSALTFLWSLAQGKIEEVKETVSTAFLLEFIHLFKGMSGRSFIYREFEGLQRVKEEFQSLAGRKAARFRSGMLDDLALRVEKYFKKYPSGLEPDVRRWRHRNVKRIIDVFGATEDDWRDYRWHLRNVVRDADTLSSLVELTPDQVEAVELAVKHRIPFGATPHYISLMDARLGLGYDHAVRAQVIPPLRYVKKMIAHKEDRGEAFDFMGEHDTSPADLITRRYPMVAILKPYNTCAQICVYCQRNWEIDSVLDAKAFPGRKKINEALDWFEEHPGVSDILITGGDPAILTDSQLEHMLDRIAAMDHVRRVRIGTRTLVVLPQRITKDFIGLLKKYHKPGKREMAIVTHFEHSYEISQPSVEAITKIRKLGIGVYNQQVFTMENSRRFETAKLRCDLRKIGVDTYYTFNAKGKDETRDYLVPIARLMQERKEEARLLPGLDRTDEPVFNVPRLGKNHVMRLQDHKLVMIKPDGSRVYEFHPWEKNIRPASTYFYTDIPIFDYIEELERRGENKSDYRTLWYYF